MNNYIPKGKKNQQPKCLIHSVFDLDFLAFSLLAFSLFIQANSAFTLGISRSAAFWKSVALKVDFGDWARGLSTVPLLSFSI